MHKKKYVCRICGYTYEGYRNELPRHIKKKHGLTYKEYYDKFLKKPNEGFCEYCGNKTHWMDNYKSYSQFCNKSCKASYEMDHEKKELMTEGFKNFLSDHEKSKNYRKKQSKKLKEQREDPEFMELSRESFWVKMSDEQNYNNWRRRISNGMIKRWNEDENYREKQESNLDRMKQTREHQINQSVGSSRNLRNLWKDPEFRRKNCRIARDTFKRRWKNPKFRKKMCKLNSEKAVRLLNDPNNSFGTRNCKRVEYKGIVFRSKLEVKFAKLLDKNEIEWGYEPCHYTLKENKRYIPDFYLPLDGIYIDVKPKRFHSSYYNIVNLMSKIGEDLFLLDIEDFDSFISDCKSRPRSKIV